MAITDGVSRRLLFLVCALALLLPCAADASPPSTPAWLNARPGDGVVSLDWGPSAPGSNGLGGYHLYRGETIIYTGLRQSYIDRGLENGLSYSYTVEAFDESDPPEVSPPSSEATAQPFSGLGSVACDQDESVVQGRPDFPYGHDYGGGPNEFMGGLFVGATADAAARGHAFVGFPLAPLPPDCALEAAWLKAWLNRTHPDCPAETPIAIHGLSDPEAAWEEVSLSWDQAPTLAENPLSVLDGPFVSPGWLRWEVTAEVAAAYTAARTRVSLALRAEDDLLAEPTTSWKYLAEREFGLAGQPDSYHPAELEMVWSADHSFTNTWHLMSLPLVPSDPSPPAVFFPHPISGNLNRWDPVAQTYVVYYSWQPGQFGPCQTGVGYWYSAVEAGPVEYVGTPHDTPQEIVCPVAGWHIIGHPFPLALPLADCQVRNNQTEEVKTIAQARAAGWISLPMYYYYPPTGGYRSCGLDPWNNDDHLRPWLGYQFSVNVPVTLIVPVPEGLL
jgi:hypothetical protein